MPELVTHRNYEIMNMCCFKLLNVWSLCRNRKLIQSDFPLLYFSHHSYSGKLQGNYEIIFAFHFKTFTLVYYPPSALLDIGSWSQISWPLDPWFSYFSMHQTHLGSFLKQTVWDPRVSHSVGIEHDSRTYMFNKCPGTLMLLVQGQCLRTTAFSPVLLSVASVIYIFFSFFAVCCDPFSHGDWYYKLLEFPGSGW